MIDEAIETIVDGVKSKIRARWDILGSVDGINGSFSTGHTPKKAPLAYVARSYAQVVEQDILNFEAYSNVYCSDIYRRFLKRCNGMRVNNLSLNGVVETLQRDHTDSIGQPISLTYDNGRLKPLHVPHGHFAIGSINGKWHSQGIIFLTSTGEVELYNSYENLVGARWPSFVAFLTEEVDRQMSLCNDDGSLREDVEFLPQDTQSWEAIGKVHSDERKRAASLKGRVKRFFKK
ncbi:MAG: hypothetical protein COB08_015500 [Rhodobacteraceae bacterium]|nr:hypothetical protein [Paracoccaceae bacterium]